MKFWPIFDTFIDYCHICSQEVSHAQILVFHPASVSESCIDAEKNDGNNDDDEYGANSQDCCAQRLISSEIPIQDNRPCGRSQVADDGEDDGDEIKYHHILKNQIFYLLERTDQIHCQLLTNQIFGIV